MLLGIADMGLGVSILLGVLKQGAFLPKNYGGCNDWQNWRNATDGRNFFDVANKTGGWDSSTSGYEICAGLVLNWGFGVAVA